MKKKLLLACLGALTAMSAMAVQALREFYPRLQPDGSTIMLMTMGDEHTSHYVTQDGIAVLSDANGAYRYATLDQQGQLKLSDMLAHEADQRTADERAMLANIDANAVISAYTKGAEPLRQPIAPENMRAINPMAVNDALAAATSNPYDRKGLLNSSYPYTGKVPALVVLVEFKDKTFSMADPYDYFYRQLNQVGFNDNGATGSAYDYYVDNSRGQFIPEFDLYGPITLPQNESYYGADYYYNGVRYYADENAPFMAIHASEILHSDTDIDFSKYDTDNDGLVDNMYLIYAGLGQAAGGTEETIWPHNATISGDSKAAPYQPTFDDVKIDRYACSCELIYQGGSERINGIGTFVHEFAHVVGLPDLYKTDSSAGSYQTPCTWDVMDQGNYNNNSNTPLGMSAFERNALGWLGDNLIEITNPGSAILPPINDTNVAAVMGNPYDTNEFYIFENRQQTGWDLYLEYPGMLVWHVEYVKSVFQKNAVNNNLSHQYVDLVEANQKDQSDISARQGTPFPGKSNVTKLNYRNGMMFWDYTYPKFDLSDIELDPRNNCIYFTANGDGDEVPFTTYEAQFNADTKALDNLETLLEAARTQLGDAAAGADIATSINDLRTAVATTQSAGKYKTPITGQQIAALYMAIDKLTAVGGIQDSVIVDDPNAPGVYYDLKGVQVAQPTPGNVYIKVVGKAAKKVIMN